jgi:membrane-associated phospholipid phosphatase
MENATQDRGAATAGAPAVSDQDSPDATTRLLPRRLRWRKLGLWVLLGIAAVAAIPFANTTHKPLHNLLSHERLDEFFATTRQITGFTFVVCLCLAIWLLDRARARYLPYLLAALLVAGAIVHVLKVSFARVRPEVSMSITANGSPEAEHLLKHKPHLPLEPRLGDQWLMGRKGTGWFDSECTSFPSGHAASAFVIAVFLAALYPRARLLWFVLAFGCALARVRFRRHFIEDAMFGAALGAIMSMWVLSWHWPGRLGDWLGTRTGRRAPMGD